MAPIQTHRAHCGACASLMVMTIGIEGIWFTCTVCGLSTPPRPTAAEADADVVWVEVPAPKQRTR